MPALPPSSSARPLTGQTMARLAESYHQRVPTAGAAGRETRVKSSLRGLYLWLSEVHVACRRSRRLLRCGREGREGRRAIRCHPGRRHRRSLRIEGCPQPARLRSVARAARARPAPRARTGPTAAPPAPAAYCAAARSSRLRPRIAPGSVRPAAPSAPRGGRMLRAPPSVARTARIHSLRVRCGLRGLYLRAGRVGPSLRRALRYGSRAAASLGPSASGGGVTPARRRMDPTGRRPCGPSPRPRRTTCGGTPTAREGPPRPRPCPAASPPSCP